MTAIVQSVPPDDSTDVSALSSADINAINRLLGSRSECHTVSDVGLQTEILDLTPNDLFRNFRRSAHNRQTDILAEDWLWLTSPADFTSALGDELVVLEDTLSAFLMYLLNGFMVPRDDAFNPITCHLPDPYVAEDKADVFLAHRISPGTLARFVYWKSTFLLMGLMRLYSVKDTTDAARRVNDRFRKNSC